MNISFQQRTVHEQAPRALSLYVSRVRLPRALAVLALASDALLLLSGAPLWSRVSLTLIGAESAAIVLALALSLSRHWRYGQPRPARICQVQWAGTGLALLLSLANLACRYMGAGRPALLPLEIALTAVSAGLLVLAGRLWRDISALLREQVLADVGEAFESA